MTKTFQQNLQTDPTFEYRDGIFYRKGFAGAIKFTATYLDIRKRETRLYSDEIVRQLPDISLKTDGYDEWPVRKKTTDRLKKYLSHQQSLKVVEIGCGNGWLINYLSKSLSFDFLGVDINEPELLQASRIFQAPTINFALADILQSTDSLKTDIFVLAGVVQYFPDLPLLIASLIGMLNPGGEIHILDSPFYNDADDMAAAKKRSKDYFIKAGVADMEKFYFFHSWQSLHNLSWDCLYQPHSILTRIRRRIFTDSPFPWIRITGVK